MCVKFQHPAETKYRSHQYYYVKRPNIVHMKTITKSYKNKDHEYERDRKQQKAMCTQYTRHKYSLIITSNSLHINHQQKT